MPRNSASSARATRGHNPDNYCLVCSVCLATVLISRKSDYGGDMMYWVAVKIKGVDKPPD